MGSSGALVTLFIIQLNLIYFWPNLLQNLQDHKIEIFNMNACIESLLGHIGSFNFSYLFTIDMVNLNPYAPSSHIICSWKNKQIKHFLETFYISVISGSLSVIDNLVFADLQDSS